MTQQKGTRCAVCTGCGKCFEAQDDTAQGWSGKRCDVCVGCGKCLEAWGLGPKDGADAESGPTNWGDAFKAMDAGQGAAPPPLPAAPGSRPDKPTVKAGHEPQGADHDATPSFADALSGEARERVAKACIALEEGVDLERGVDASTGATPGVAAACKELGLDDMESLNRSLGIKPPGQA